MNTTRIVLIPLAVAAASCGGLAAVEGQKEASASATSECDRPSTWIWCDDFETDRLASYFEYDSAEGSFERVMGVGVDGSHGMRVRFAKGQVSAGFLHLAMGKTPQSYFRPVDDGEALYRDVYWRVYLRNEPRWRGGGGHKLSRATSFVSPDSWAQSMIAHLWSGGSDPNWNYLVLDPASGTDVRGRIVTTAYNDFDNLRWLGKRAGLTPLFDVAHVGKWYCIEAHVRLNDPGRSNGVFELWIDGRREAGRSDLDWVGRYAAFGINAVFLENYWNGGAPADQERYFDRFVVGTTQIGC